MVTEAQYNDLKARYERKETWVKANAWNGSKWISYSPDSLPLDSRCSNAETSEIETYEFMRDKPTSYTSYTSAHIVTTWTGQRLGEILWSSGFWRNNMGDQREQLIVLGDNGIFYSVLSFGTGMYNHMKAYKNQASYQKRYANAFAHWRAVHRATV